MRLLATAGGVTHTVEVDEGNGTGLLRVNVDDREYLIDVTNPAPGLYSLLVRGRVFSAFVAPRRGRREVQVGNWSVSVEVASAQSQRPSVKADAAVGGRSFPTVWPPACCHGGVRVRCRQR